MLLTVKANYPKDMEALEDSLFTALAEILLKKYNENEIDQYIEHLSDSCEKKRDKRVS